MYLSVLNDRMLDDFGNELENTESKMDSTMKKMAKVLNLNNGNLIASHGHTLCSSHAKCLPTPSFIFPYAKSFHCF